MKVTLPPVSDPEKSFVLADYVQWSWAYAISVGRDNGEVVLQFGTKVSNDHRSFICRIHRGVSGRRTGTLRAPSRFGEDSISAQNAVTIEYLPSVPRT
jgi:hypothetical protein